MELVAALWQDVNAVIYLNGGEQITSVLERLHARIRGDEGQAKWS